MYARHFNIIICAPVLMFAAFPGCQPGSSEGKKNKILKYSSSSETGLKGKKKKSISEQPPLYFVVTSLNLNSL